MAPPSPLQAIVYALQDCVMLLAPPGWAQVTLHFTATPGGPRLSHTEVKGEGAAAPEARAELGVDPQEEAIRLSDGVAELVELIAQKGKRWTPGTIEVARTESGCDWRLVGADGGLVWFTRLSADELGLLLMSDAMFRAVRGSQKAFAALQASLEQRLGVVTGFAFSTQTGQLEIEREGQAPLAVPAELVGRYDVEHYTWSWGWAQGGRGSDRVKRVCAPDAQMPGMSAFWREAFLGDEAFAFALAGHVAVALGARGLFRAERPDSPEVLLFAVFG